MSTTGIHSSQLASNYNSYNYYNIIIPDLMDSWTNLIYQERVSTTFVELPHQSEFFEDIETVSKCDLADAVCLGFRKSFEKYLAK